MNFLKHSLFLSLLFTHCFGMEFFFEKSKEQIITGILDQLKEKDAAQTLDAAEFWDMMAMDTLTSEKDTVLSADTSERACFLAEFITNAYEKDICLVFKYLIIFGQQDKNKFYECITKCTGCNSITPINELILLIQSEDSNIYKLFLQLLDLIKTLDEEQITALLNKEDLYRPCPKIFARNLGKLYIADAIDKIILEAALPWSSAWTPDGNFITIASAGITQPPIGRWDGSRFLSPKPRFSSPGFSSPKQH